jgi:hypothetical protein
VESPALEILLPDLSNSDFRVDYFRMLAMKVKALCGAPLIDGLKTAKYVSTSKRATTGRKALTDRSPINLVDTQSIQICPQQISNGSTCITLESWGAQVWEDVTG